MRLRWDSGYGFEFPDRAEFFWARADGNGKGPRPVAPALGERSLRYREFSLYTEAAVEKFGLFVEIPYRSFDAEVIGHEAGFADMNVGTKSLLLDCELLQIAFQFKTYIPTASAAKGLGTGHVSLEPSLLFAVRIAQDTYFQAQTAYWIPIGGDPDYQGDIFHYHVSLNQVIWRPMPDVQLIATLELNGWTVIDGAMTDPVLGTVPASDNSLYSAGPGLRLVICDRIDFGLGTAFAFTDNHWADDLYRAEFRWRF